MNKNRELFLSNSEIHEINTRYNQNLHMPSTNLTLVQKVVLYSGSEIYSHLPLSIKAHSNDAKRFKATLKRYLIEHVFYSLDEYYQFQWLWLFIYFIHLFIYILYFSYSLITIRHYVTWSLTCSYFNTFMLLCLDQFCSGCFVNCDCDKCFAHSVYFYVSLWLLLYL